MANLDDWLTIGRIVAPQGLNGELRVYPMSDFPERFLEPGERWLLRPHETEPEPIQLLSGRFIGGKGLYVLELEGIRYRDQAERLRDAMLLVPASDRPILEDDEYHVMDLIGVQVVDHVTGDLIGIIKDIIPAGNDLLEVELIPSPATPMAPQSGDAEPAIASDTGGHTTPASIPPPSTSLQESGKNAANAERGEDATQFLRKKGRRARAKQSKKKKKAVKAPTVLIPFVPEIVPVVDLDAGRIAIAPPPGLLENLPNE